MDGNLIDPHGREVTYLRVSVTDRCDFRCVYCMPREIFGPNYQFVPRGELLRLEEIFRIAKVFAINVLNKMLIDGQQNIGGHS